MNNFDIIHKSQDKIVQVLKTLRKEMGKQNRALSINTQPTHIQFFFYV